MDANGRRRSVSAPLPTTDRPRALAALTANLMLPGAGSILLGRRVGWAQAALALAGMALSLHWLTRVVGLWVRAGERPLLEPEELIVGIVGPALFAVTWAWSALTALRVLRRLPAERSAPSP
jgi:hypothetical protein